jgi:hypothetical protein
VERNNTDKRLREGTWNESKEFGEHGSRVSYSSVVVCTLILTHSHHLLYLKPTHALILKHTFTSTFIKTLKLVKNVL